MKLGTIRATISTPKQVNGQPTLYTEQCTYRKTRRGEINHGRDTELLSRGCSVHVGVQPGDNANISDHSAWSGWGRSFPGPTEC